MSSDTRFLLQRQAAAAAFWFLLFSGTASIAVYGIITLVAAAATLAHFPWRAIVSPVAAAVFEIGAAPPSSTPVL